MKIQDPGAFFLLPLPLLLSLALAIGLSEIDTDTDTVWKLCAVCCVRREA